VWPRAQSKLFEEPKKLVAHGYAKAREESVGKRPRTVYSITPAGRRALARWLSEPGDGPALEFEGLVKLLFAEYGTRDDALASIRRAREWAVESNTSSVEAGRRFVERGGRFEQRRATTLLLGAFLTDFYALVATWADWAEELVSDWPADMESPRVDVARTREVLERARWSEGEER
jgi:DNA-binding PadR family transcriptional regulator